MMMTSKPSNFSDLIQRVTSSCLLNPIGSGRHYPLNIHSDEPDTDSDHYQKSTIKSEKHSDDDDDDETEEMTEKERADTEMVTLMNDVFETVSCMKKAYVRLQQAHCPWDIGKMRSSDMAVVMELKKLGVLRERFRRVGDGKRVVAGVEVREVVAPYEAAIERLKMEVKSKEAEIESLKEKLSMAAVSGGSSGRKSRSQSNKKVNYGSQLQGFSTFAYGNSNIPNFP